MEIKKVELTEEQQVVVDYQFIWNDYSDGLSYVVSREMYERAMKLFKGMAREGEIDSKTYLHDVWDAKQRIANGVEERAKPKKSATESEQGEGQ